MPHVNQQTVANNQNCFEYWYELKSGNKKEQKPNAAKRVEALQFHGNHSNQNEDSQAEKRSNCSDSIIKPASKIFPLSTQTLKPKSCTVQNLPAR